MNERLFWRYSILGVAPKAKGNRREILENPQTGKPFSAKSPEARAFCESLIQKLWAQHALRYNDKLPDDAMFGVCGRIVYPSWLPDLDASLVKDCIEKAGLIVDDRRIRIEHWDASEVDSEQFGVEFCIFRIGVWTDKKKAVTSKRCLCPALHGLEEFDAKAI